MRIIFIGCVEMSLTLLQHTYHLPNVKLVGVVTKKNASSNSDFCSLKSFADEHHIPCYIMGPENKLDFAEWIRKFNADVAYCFGWSQMLSAQVLAAPRMGVIGYHPTPLPRNRGRHPIVWSLALGLEETASTFFFYG